MFSPGKTANLTTEKEGGPADSRTLPCGRAFSDNKKASTPWAIEAICAPPEVVCGAGERIRTSDLRITNALLYQLSYTGNQIFSELIVLRVAHFTENFEKCKASL